MSAAAGTMGADGTTRGRTGTIVPVAILPTGLPCTAHRGTGPLEAALQSLGLQSRVRRAVGVRPRCLRDRARRHDRRAGRELRSGAHGIIGAGPET